jgi:BlaI family penicillinase repressor
MQQPTDTELALLRLLWVRDSATIRELTDEMYPGGGHSSYATVQSLLDRLEAKDLVARRREGRVNVFTATVSRADLVRRRLRETADNLCDGSMAPLLSHLVTDVELDEDEAQTLHRLVQRLGGDPGEGVGR